MDAEHFILAYGSFKHILKLFELSFGLTESGVAYFIDVFFEDVILALEETASKVAITTCVRDVAVCILPLGTEGSIVIIYQRK